MKENRIEYFHLILAGKIRKICVTRILVRWIVAACARSLTISLPAFIDHEVSFLVGVAFAVVNLDGEINGIVARGVLVELGGDAVGVAENELR